MSSVSIAASSTLITKLDNRRRVALTDRLAALGSDKKSVMGAGSDAQ